jgi:hypothetical protein
MSPGRAPILKPWLWDLASFILYKPPHVLDVRSLASTNYKDWHSYT